MSLLNRDKMVLIKQDGEQVEGIVGTLTGGNFAAFSVRQNGVPSVIRVDPKDLLVRKTSVGDETYEVIDPVFYEVGVGGMGAHYQCKLRKLGLPEAKAAVQNITYNVSGNNARVNVNSNDASINTVNLSVQIEQHIQDLREAILNEGLSAEQVREALEIVEAVKEQFDSGAPKRSVVKAMLEAIPAVGKIAAAVSAIIAAL